MTQDSILAMPNLPLQSPASSVAADPAINYQRKLRVKRRRFMLVYFLALLVAFSPSKELGLIGPFVIIAGLIFYVQLRPNYHLQRIMLAGLLFIGIGLVYWLLLPDFWWPNYLFGAITFCAAIFLLFDFSPLLDVRYLRRLGRLTFYFIVFQSLYGIAQFVLAVATYGYSNTSGDFVWGTLAPPNNSGYAGTSPIFILLLSTLLLFALATTTQKLPLFKVIGFLTVTLCWMVASLLHSVVFFTIAIVLALCFLAIFRPRRRLQGKYKRKGTFVAIVMLVILVGAGILVHPSNYSRISTVLNGITEIGPDAKFRKLSAIYITVIELPKEAWWQPFIGVGPGQYSSRAAMIATGDYLTRASIPFLPEHTGEYTARYIMPFFFASNSSTHSPTSSWIALYGELGLIGWATLLLLLFYTIRRFSRFSSPELPRLSFAMITLVFYLFLMGFQNVYWEYTQGIYPAILIVKLCHDFVRQEQRARSALRVVSEGEPIAASSMVLLEPRTNHSV